MKKILLMLIGISLLSVSCGTSSAPATKETPTYAAIVVDTTTALIYTDFAAELQSEQVVEIRPRVSGYLDRIAVREGARVKKGQVLFVINQDDLQEEYNAATAEVDAAEATVANAKLEVEKLTPLVEKGIISEFELKNAVSSLAAAEAQYRAANSVARNAKISLGYATITSPVSGYVGRIVVRSGTLVSQSSADPLTTVSSLGPVSAYFSISENLLLDILAVSKNNGKNIKDILSMMPKASLILPNGNLYGDKGKVELASGLVDMTTGSVQLKATFPNKSEELRSGGSAKVRINSPYSGVVVIPQSATYDVQDKIMVYMVDSSGVVNSHNIEIFGREGTNYVVKEGLKIGDKIVAEGLDFIKDGDKIKTK